MCFQGYKACPDRAENARSGYIRPTTFASEPHLPRAEPFVAKSLPTNLQSSGMNFRIVVTYFNSVGIHFGFSDTDFVTLSSLQ